MRILLGVQNKSNDALKQVIEALRRDKLQRQRILKRLVRAMLPGRAQGCVGFARRELVTAGLV